MLIRNTITYYEFFRTEFYRTRTNDSPLESDRFKTFWSGSNNAIKL
jgi:hypothetical protein